MAASVQNLSPLAFDFARALVLAQNRVGREDLADYTGASRATSARVLNSLHDSGWAIREGSGASSGGRRPILWSVAADAAYTACLVVGVRKISAALMDLQGGISHCQEGPLRLDAGAEGLLSDGTDLVRRVLKSSCLSQDQILGLGVKAPGSMDHRRGCLSKCAYFSDVEWWEGLPLPALLEEALGLPVVMETHARIVGEHWFGVHRNVANMLYVNVEMQGLGCGVLANGLVYHGVSGITGELGHMSIDLAGRPCRCGNRGCLETYVSGFEMVRQAEAWREAGNESLVFESLAEGEEPEIGHILEAAEQDDRVACAILEETGLYLGVGIANLINLFNPALVVLGGVLEGGGERLLEPVRRKVSLCALRRPLEDVEIVCAASGRDTELRSAGATVLQGVFGSPSFFGKA